jgi:hypothetical protein
MTVAENLSSNKAALKTTFLLVVGDWLALALFVLIGQADHGLIGDNPLPRLLATTAELALPWTIIGWLLGAFRYSGTEGWRQFLGRTLVAWLAAAPLALLLRAYLHGQVAIIAIFMAITLTLGGLFLLAWRLVFFAYSRHARQPA